MLPAHLVRVYEERRRILAQQLQLPVRLGLRAREPVAVEVEVVVVAAGGRLAAIRVLRGRDHHNGVVEDLLRSAVVTVRQLVENAQVGVGTGFLVPMDVPREPENRGGGRGQLPRPRRPTWLGRAAPQCWSARPRGRQE